MMLYYEVDVNCQLFKFLYAGTYCSQFPFSLHLFDTNNLVPVFMSQGKIVYNCVNSRLI